MRRKKLFDLDKLIIQETQRAMDGIVDRERRLQQVQSEKNKPFKAKEKSREDINKNGEQEDVDEAEDNEDSGAKVKRSSLPEVDMSAIADLVDTIRAGKSLRDKKTRADLKAYYQRLNEEERLALYAFLSGLAEVMTDPEGDAGEDAPHPAKDPYKLRMSRSAPKVDKNEKSKGEDSPIVVGEAADKSRERNILLSNFRRRRR